jgi:hypothetical protein
MTVALSNFELNFSLPTSVVREQSILAQTACQVSAADFFGSRRDRAENSTGASENGRTAHRTSKSCPFRRGNVRTFAR